MQRAVCGNCGEKQPADWAPGDLCVMCGAAVRREVRCAWGAEWVPAGRFCRICGCELVDDSLYGAARILKSAGVDRFSLAQRLREMGEEQQANLARIYDAQRAIVLRRVDEARLCEKYLLQRGYADGLEDQLIRMLPASQDDLDSLASGPKGPFFNFLELLPEIAQQSPVISTRTLASIALVRLGRFGGREFTAVGAGLDADQPIAAESAMAIAHWRTRLYACARVTPRPEWWHGFDSSKLVRAARTVRLDSPLGPWAAAALALGLFLDRAGALPGPLDPVPMEEHEAAEELRAPLQDGLASNDPDLRFTCAMALGENEIVAQELHGSDVEKYDVARRFLAKKNSPSLSRLLSGGPRDLQAEILQNLSPPLPEALVAPVLTAVEEGDAEARDRAVWLLQSNLTASAVNRLAALALKENDPGLFRDLLRTKDLPEKQGVIRAVIAAGLLPRLGDLFGLFHENAFSLDFSDEEFLKRTCANDPDTLGTLLTLVLWEVQRGPANEQALLDIGRFLAHVAFGPHPMNLRLQAYELLTDYRMSPLLDWLEPPATSRLLGGMKGLVQVIVTLVDDPASGQLRYDVINDVYGHWDKVVAAIGESPGLLSEFLSAVHKCARGDSFPYLAAHTQLLAQTAAIHPQEAFSLLLDLLSDVELIHRCPQIPAYVRYDELSGALRERPSLAGDFVEVLTRHLKPGSSMDYPWIVLMHLLARILTDFPVCRGKVAEKLMPVLEDLDSYSDDAKDCLQRLTELIGSVRPETPSDDTETQPSPSEILDHKVLLPGQPLTTLADYVAFIKELSTSSNPLEVMARHNLHSDQYAECVLAWCDLISRRDDVAIRYAHLCNC